MLDNLSKYDIVLASNSPRRRDLLLQLGLGFKIRVLEDIDESCPAGLSGEEAAKHIALKKAEAYRTRMDDNDLLITADTIVCIDNTILGKPRDAAEAKAMLRQLSGRTHQVVTGVAIVTKTRTESFAVVSDVVFATLDDEVIDFYVDNYSPLDKAGAYGIQEWIGLVAVEGLRGSFFNVMGLPVQRLFKALKQF